MNTGPIKAYDDWHWWCAHRDARSPAQKEFEKLPPPMQAELLSVMERWLVQEHVRSEYDSLGRGLHELRVREGNNHFRVLFAVEGRVCIVLNSFPKNSQKTPPERQKTARKRMGTGTSRPIRPA